MSPQWGAPPPQNREPAPPGKGPPGVESLAGPPKTLPNLSGGLGLTPPRNDGKYWALPPEGFKGGFIRGTTALPSGGGLYLARPRGGGSLKGPPRWGAVPSNQFLRRGGNNFPAEDCVKMKKMLWDAIGREIGGRHELYERK